MSRFIISYDGENTDKRQFVVQPPSIDDIREHLIGLHFRQGSVLYYLNGMSLNRTSWAHGEVHDDAVDLRYRQVDESEFEAKWLLVDDYPPRTWTDQSGKHATTARFVSYAAQTVTLRRNNGRRLQVAYDLLSSSDKHYVVRLFNFH